MGYLPKRLRENSHANTSNKVPSDFKGFTNFPKNSSLGFFVKVFLTLVFSALTVYFSLWVASSLFSFFLYIVAAFILAVSFEPLVVFLEKYMKRIYATFIVFSSTIALAVVALVFFGNIIFVEFSKIFSSFPDKVDSFIKWVNSVAPFANFSSSFMEDFSFTDFSSMLAPSAFGVFSGFFSFSFGLLIIFVFAWYFSAYNPSLRVSILKIVPPNHREGFSHAWASAIDSSGRFLFSKIILASLSSFFHIIAFWALGVPYWFALGIFAGVTSQFIPVIGTYLGIIVPAFLSISYDPWLVVWIIVFATFYQQIENYIFTPRVAGRVLKINSGLALASTIIGFALFGPIGALLGMPVFAIIVSVFSFYNPR